MSEISDSMPTPSLNELGQVYCLSNVSIPGLIKIGFAGVMEPSAAQELIDAEIEELFTKSIPTPFKLEYKCGTPAYEERMSQAVLNEFRAFEHDFFRISPLSLRRVLYCPEAFISPGDEGEAPPQPLETTQEFSIQTFHQNVCRKNYNAFKEYVESKDSPNEIPICFNIEGAVGIDAVYVKPSDGRMPWGPYVWKLIADLEGEKVEKQGPVTFARFLCDEMKCCPEGYWECFFIHHIKGRRIIFG